MSNSATSHVTEAAPPTHNRLLARLEPLDYEKIAPCLEHVKLSFQQILFEPNAKITHVYFPTSGSLSTICLANEGDVEICSVGFEGFAGVSALLHADSMPTRTLVQADGHAYRIRVAAFRTIVAESEGMQRLFARYTLSLLNQVAQSVACNRLHSLESRCARWLLIAHDRVEGAEIHLTQESLSYMLGVHRPAVTLAAGLLHKAGLIDYSRGKIHVTDRSGLEDAACRCYKTVRDDYESLVGGGAPLP